MSHQTPDPGFQSGTYVQQVQQKDGRWTIVVIQANIVPVSAADVGNSELVAQMAMGTINRYEPTMTGAELAEHLRWAADEIDRQP
jgi:hypothetical protein